MMSPSLALQSSIVESLAHSSALSGIYYDAPARAAYPYAVITCIKERDWSCKGREGREVALHVTLWDDQPARLLALESGIRLDQPFVVGAPWHLSSLVHSGTSRTRNPAGAWSCVLEYRARLIAVDGEAGA